jgi:hypothetical protein
LSFVEKIQKNGVDLPHLLGMQVQDAIPTKIIDAQKEIIRCNIKRLAARLARD